MKKILGLVLSLTVISGVCAAVLAYVNEITEKPIKKTAHDAELAAVKVVMPAGVEAVGLVDATAYSGQMYYMGTDAKGEVIGYAAKGKDTHGYGGEITLMVGFMPDKKTVVCYKVLAAAETPGLGMKLKTPEFAGQFAGKDGRALKVKKDGGEIEAITSATITSRAVCRAIADAQSKLVVEAK